MLARSFNPLIAEYSRLKRVHGKRLAAAICAAGMLYFLRTLLD